MESETVELGSAHVKAIKAVLNTSEEISGELDDQLPEGESSVELELENKHREMLSALLSGYKDILTEELPEGEEYHADFDVIKDVEDEIHR
ncbi:hypothetical protein HKK80_12605 [Halonotius sp. F2-221B]|jgi:hypothetical protein|uniref:hypothetical protein n=1 Tax=Halonotius sp. F2-221B TaxID=2731620 RepID=UPI00398AB37E